MTFWQILLRLAPLKPAESLAALWWHVTRRRVRARNLLKAAAADLPLFYRWWIDEVEPGRSGAIAASGDGGPTFTVAIEATSADGPGIERSLQSIERQTHSSWHVLLPLDFSGRQKGEPRLSLIPQEGAGGKFLNSALREAEGDYIVILRAGDVLAPWALASLADAFAQRPDATIAYGDHDTLDEHGGRNSPWFKPDWNEELFLAQDYVTTVCAVSVEVAKSASRVSLIESFYELVLRIAMGGAGSVVHVPHVLAHVEASTRGAPLPERLTAIERVLGGSGVQACEGPYGSLRIKRPLCEPEPMVTIIVPTKDKVDLLSACVHSVLAKTDYPAFEIIIVDNGSAEQSTLRFFQEIQSDDRVRVLHASIPYNFSALNNLAALQARGSFLCLLNNDTEVVSADWLTEMMSYAQQDDVGAVGAKLLYADGTIQHAGVVVGMGDAAGHVHRHVSNDEPGYHAQPHVTRSVTAVTAACLLVAKDKYAAVGGLDEIDLAIAYNDIDFCLKLREAGWRNVYAAHAVLLHHESKSRPADHAPSQFQRYSRELRTFQQRWGTKGFVDPEFNPNLDPACERVVVRFS